ncbi:MAG: thioredoxin domain-containing protein [Myxococcales bacterium]|nr:thioredoxin domain-containing protein [Myxococcales bacterium]
MTTSSCFYSGLGLGLVLMFTACNQGTEASATAGSAATAATAGGAGKPAATGKTPEPAEPVKSDTSPDGKAGTAGAADAGGGEQIMEARGVDLSKLGEPQKKSFFQIINSEPSACGKAHSLAVSLRDDSTCRDSLSVSQFVADMLGTGASPGDIKDNMEPLIASLQPRPIDIQGRPIYGNERAPVTVVVFADFECPMCKQEAPELRAAVDAARGRARLVFKHFPLPMHPRAKPAAIAAAAAHEQGKFWAMHDQIFAHQEALSDADLRKYAEAAGLDLAKFDASYSARSGQTLVEADRAEGEKLNIAGTPAVFVNGREMNRFMFGGTVGGWIDDALRR